MLVTQSNFMWETKKKIIKKKFLQPIGWYRTMPHSGECWFSLCSLPKTFFRVYTKLMWTNLFFVLNGMTQNYRWLFTKTKIICKTTKAPPSRTVHGSMHTQPLTHTHTYVRTHARTLTFIREMWAFVIYLLNCL